MPRRKDFAALQKTRGMRRVQAGRARATSHARLDTGALHERGSSQFKCNAGTTSAREVPFPGRKCRSSGRTRSSETLRAEDTTSVQRAHLYMSTSIRCTSSAQKEGLLLYSEREKDQEAILQHIHAAKTGQISVIPIGEDHTLKREPYRI